MKIEISMSARLWTSGYDIFAPTMNVLDHYYVRRHYPKFWETTNRFFKRPIHNDLVEIVIKRVKNMLGYSESIHENIFPKNILYNLDNFNLGKKRSFEEYMKFVSLDVKKKTVKKNNWCHEGEYPENIKKYKINKI